MENKINAISPLFGVKRIVLVTAIVVAASLVSSTGFAQQHVPWVSPKTAIDIKNPVPVDKVVLAEAKTLYTANCAPCHGDKGRGDGPAAPALNPKPADHSSALVQAETDGSLYWKLSEGRNPMPAYKSILTDRQRWELVHYIRTLARNVKK